MADVIEALILARAHIVANIDVLKHGAARDQLLVDIIDEALTLHEAPTLQDARPRAHGLYRVWKGELETRAYYYRHGWLPAGSDEALPDTHWDRIGDRIEG